MQNSRTIGIIGAMDCETARLKDLMHNIISLRANRLTIYKGEIENHTVILVKSGVGKVNGALCTQYIIDNFKPDYIINTGIAGALADNLQIGDIVIGENLIQHDFDATDLGYAKGYMCTGTAKDKPTIYHSDKNLIEKFENAAKEFHPELRLHRGTIATGDMFIGSRAKRQNITDTFNASASEMEGAAIAQTAVSNNVPCIIVRAISDLADGTICDSLDYMAAERSASTVLTLLKVL